MIQRSDSASYTKGYVTDGTKRNVFHFDTCTPTKFFTYLSAGLPIIINKEFSYIVSLVKRYDYETLKANVKKAKEVLSMKNHISRLIEFYKQACKESANG